MAAIETEIVHELSVERLTELLKLLPPTALLVPNAVRNLAIVHEELYIGYISFLPPGEVDLFDTPW